MNSKLVAILAFASGAAVGSVATWQFVKKKYEQIAQEEIDSVTEAFSYKKSDDNDALETCEEDDEDSDIAEYTAVVRNQKYAEEQSVDEKDAPYVIPPEAFGEFENYEQICLSYLSDGVLVDDNDDVLEDLAGTIGADSLTRFGEYEDDSVHVRNDRLKCDYEIILEQKSYADLLMEKPYKAERVE